MGNIRTIPLMGEVNAGEERRSLKRILGNQPVHLNLTGIFEDIEKDWADCNTKLFVYNSIYNYGVMQGKREERARRNNRQGGIR